MSSSWTTRISMRTLFWHVFRKLLLTSPKNSISAGFVESHSPPAERKIIIRDIILSVDLPTSKILPFATLSLRWLSSSNYLAFPISIFSLYLQITETSMYTKPKAKIILAMSDSLFVLWFDHLESGTRFQPASISYLKQIDWLTISLMRFRYWDPSGPT